MSNPERNRGIHAEVFASSLEITRSSSGERRSATIDNIPMPKTKSDPQAALLAILTLLHSVQTLEGTDKDGVEHLLEMAVENLRER
jgi:hypothetical protein